MVIDLFPVYDKSFRFRFHGFGLDAQKELKNMF